MCVCFILFRIRRTWSLGCCFVWGHVWFVIYLILDRLAADRIKPPGIFNKKEGMWPYAVRCTMHLIKIHHPRAWRWTSVFLKLFCISVTSMYRKNSFVLIASFADGVVLIHFFFHKHFVLPIVLLAICLFSSYSICVRLISREINIQIIFATSAANKIMYTHIN